jgi:hypothetical protein
MISWEKPLLKKIEETAAEHASSLNDSEREQVRGIFWEIAKKADFFDKFAVLWNLIIYF